jgi:predicted dehydrogenase
LERRYSAYYQATKMMVAKGLIGNVTHIIAQWHRNPGWQMRTDAESQKEANWRLYREYSGGLTAELLCHQIDVASWMFGSQPEFVVGIGGQEFIRDGRDIYDNVQLMFKYPRGQKFVCTAISTNQHLPLFEETRTEAGERIMGTGGTIEITLGTDDAPGIGLWYYEPRQTQVSKMGKYDEGTIATATLGASATAPKAIRSSLRGTSSSARSRSSEEEMKYARRWLYSKRIMMPREERNRWTLQMESFLNAAARARPKADGTIGLPTPPP